MKLQGLACSGPSGSFVGQRLTAPPLQSSAPLLARHVQKKPASLAPEWRRRPPSQPAEQRALARIGLAAALIVLIPARRAEQLRANVARLAAAIVPPIARDAEDASKRVSLVVDRLNDAESSLQLSSSIAEVLYSSLGLVSLALGVFSCACQGQGSLPMTLSLTSVGLSLLFCAGGWWQARGTRLLSQRCKLAASSLTPIGATGEPLPPQVHAVLPPVRLIERRLLRRERTAWLGALFAIVGLHMMVGMLVAKVLVQSAASGRVTVEAAGSIASKLSSGVRLDAFTLLMVSNCALSHIVGAGLASVQRRQLPQPRGTDDSDSAYRGWDRQ
eukprot:TRINITY_DN66701_c0_g1_i1.p1 TRINITY_DN66701_c0_g1~~TRINITY_DN66701_c0_g1_i1.p1  ORF type:complete len:330 (-),score=62.65 TRINITY_DN66701_c0_g1_i1:35-1024(-)